VSPLTDWSSEKYLKRLAGRTDVEDAMKRLDKLTQEEARMATTQVLGITHSVYNKVEGIDGKVTVVIHGAQIVFS
jgi:hypothetical protein